MDRIGVGLLVRFCKGCGRKGSLCGYGWVVASLVGYVGYVRNVPLTMGAEGIVTLCDLTGLVVCVVWFVLIVSVTVWVTVIGLLVWVMVAPSSMVLKFTLTVWVVRSGRLTLVLIISGMLGNVVCRVASLRGPPSFSFDLTGVFYGTSTL